MSGRSTIEPHRDWQAPNTPRDALDISIMFTLAITIDAAFSLSRLSKHQTSMHETTPLTRSRP